MQYHYNLNNFKNHFKADYYLNIIKNNVKI